MAIFKNRIDFAPAASQNLLSLAMRAVAGPSGKDRVLEGLVFHALHGHEGVWSDNFDDGHEGDVWHRQDPNDTCAFESPPAYTTTYEGAIQALPEGVWIRQLRQTSDGGTWICTLLGSDLPDEEAAGHGPDLFRAILNAALIVRART